MILRSLLTQTSVGFPDSPAGEFCWAGSPQCSGCCFSQPFLFPCSGAEAVSSTCRCLGARDSRHLLGFFSKGFLLLAVGRIGAAAERATASSSSAASPNSLPQGADVDQSSRSAPRDAPGWDCWAVQGQELHLDGPCGSLPTQEI